MVLEQFGEILTDYSVFLFTVTTLLLSDNPCDLSSMEHINIQDGVDNRINDLIVRPPAALYIQDFTEVSD